MARTPSAPAYDFSAFASKWSMLVFLGKVGASGSTNAMATLDGARSMFDGAKASLFCVTADPNDQDRVQDTRLALVFRLRFRGVAALRSSSGICRGRTGGGLQTT